MASGTQKRAGDHRGALATVFGMIPVGASNQGINSSRRPPLILIVVIDPLYNGGFPFAVLPLEDMQVRTWRCVLRHERGLIAKLAGTEVEP